MRVRMTKTSNGCNDGIRQNTYEAGQEYELSDSLAKCFFDMKVCEAVGGDESKSQKSMTDSDYQNKVVKPKNNKGDK